jgi:hypothetical protein
MRCVAGGWGVVAGSQRRTSEVLAHAHAHVVAEPDCAIALSEVRTLTAASAGPQKGIDRIASGNLPESISDQSRDKAAKATGSHPDRADRPRVHPVRPEAVGGRSEAAQRVPTTGPPRTPGHPRQRTPARRRAGAGPVSLALPEEGPAARGACMREQQGGVAAGLPDGTRLGKSIIRHSTAGMLLPFRVPVINPADWFAGMMPD